MSSMTFSSHYILYQLLGLANLMQCYRNNDHDRETFHQHHNLSWEHQGVWRQAFEPDIKLSNTEIWWTKVGVSGVVHEFNGDKDHLKDPDEMFKGQTAVFAEQVIGGNAP
ncbi:Alpha-protein kinase 3 [Platysternon megacephalum]|uniref:Alpha-protein kinase 3 n=1 Tax=Platysternon megacephalum TaxID=55544 RepID=A0A4D9DZJ8_9SAUR|nr:Alpha-protein kinase 3 [Platysternon megacephalum]